MKLLIVYFSHTGNNRLLAEHLAQRLGCDLCPIVEKKRRTWLTMLLDMIFRREPQIEPLDVSLADFEHAILVAPIWAMMVASPLKSLVRREQSALREYSFITLCGYERPEQKEHIAHELTTLIGHPPREVCEVRLSDLFPVEKRKDVRTISRYRAKNADLAFFAPQIDEFLEHIGAVQTSGAKAASAVLAQ